MLDPSFLVFREKLLHYLPILNAHHISLKATGSPPLPIFYSSPTTSPNTGDMEMQTLQGLRVSCPQMTLPQRPWRGRWRCPNEVPGHWGWSVRGGGSHYVVSSPLLIHPLVRWRGFDQPCPHWGLRVVLPGASVYPRESTASRAPCREARSHRWEFRWVSD